MLFQGSKERGNAIPKVADSNALTGSVAAIQASFICLATTYLVEYVEEWPVSRASPIHKPIGVTLLIAS